MSLNGSELAGFIKERQAKEARRLFQSNGVEPKLAIIQAKDETAINTYVNLKKKYGEDIGVAVDIIRCAQEDLLDEINRANEDATVHGIIVQLPIPDDSELDSVLNAVLPEKDVDGLGKRSEFDSASATAILWLLAGYNIDLRGKQIVVVGQGRLVGAPLTEMLKSSGHQVVTCDSRTEDLANEIKQAEVLITATGTPRLIKSDWIQPGCVVIDAGTASEQGEIVGDLDDRVYERTDIKVTPRKGGVGPLTICALFDNLLRATSKTSAP